MVDISHSLQILNVVLDGILGPRLTSSSLESYAHLCPSVWNSLTGWRNFLEIFKTAKNFQDIPHPVRIIIISVILDGGEFKKWNGLSSGVLSVAKRSQPFHSKRGSQQRERRINTRFIKVEIGHLVGQFVSHDCFFPPIKGPRDRRGFLKSAFVPARWQFHPISRHKKKKKKKKKRERLPRVTIHSIRDATRLASMPCFAAIFITANTCFCGNFVSYISLLRLVFS